MSNVTKSLSLAVLAATTSALTACAAPDEGTDMSSTSAASTALAFAVGSGCALAARQGELTVQLIEEDRVLVTFYDTKGRAYVNDQDHTFQAEFRTKRLPDGSIAALSRATGGGNVFTLARNGSGYRLAFTRDNGQEGGYEEWEGFAGDAICSLGAGAGVPALPTILAPAAPKTVSAGYALDADALPKACTTTNRNAKGELFELLIATKGWGPHTSYWTFVRYDAAGHADIATHTLGADDGDTFALQDFDRRPDAESEKVTIGEIATKRGGDGKLHLVLTPSPRVYHPLVHQEARLTDVVGPNALELHCQ